MDILFQRIAAWLKGILIDGTMSNLKGIFDGVNQQVGQVAGQVGMTPSAFAPDIFSMIRQISETVIMPIAGVILTFVACWELVQMVTEHNNLANLDTWMFLKWIFKTAIAVLIISNTFNIVMAVFDVSQSVISQSAGMITGSTAVSGADVAELEAELKQMDVGPLFGMFLESFLLSATMRILSIVVFVIIDARMIEIYLMTSLAPIPMATLANKERSQIGQNYFRSLLALGFQGFLILIVVGIYAALIRTFAVSGHPIEYVWGVVGYTVLLVFTLFRTGSISKSIFSAH